MCFDFLANGKRIKLKWINGKYYKIVIHKIFIKNKIKNKK